MDLDNPNGIYRTNTLARINVVDKIDTPLAQAELEEFREKFSRLAQQMLRFQNGKNPCNIPENICLLDVGTGIRKSN